MSRFEDLLERKMPLTKANARKIADTLTLAMARDRALRDSKLI